MQVQSRFDLGCISINMWFIFTIVVDSCWGPLGCISINMWFIFTIVVDSWGPISQLMDTYGGYSKISIPFLYP